ncbi:MAG: hypothetical protein GWN94_24155, partial [Phycisphaerae bacterium]|nr:hypothetical protein [Phycisphaerae bacterium]NIS54147.1 hypothetical protein [Phycisphaerae bacterium]NIW47387.1 hypothetical protein [Gammaproteobacteria bacterium]NIX01853.1 hypothetical protein [Phycisphaerae bacterium]
MKSRFLITVLILIGLFVTVNISYSCPQTPVAILTAFREYVILGRSVTLDGSDSYDPDGSGGINGIWEFEWDFTDNNSYDYSEDCWYGDNAPDGSFDGITTHTYDSNGTYTVRLRVTDEDYYTDTDTCTVNVSGDFDGDGLPDDYEDDLDYGLDNTDPNDADQDFDSDGYNNLSEYLHGSVPNDSNSTPDPNFNITIYVPVEVDSIQRAINASIDGDTILVSKGTYNESIDFEGISCTLTSTDPNDWSVTANTIINADDPNAYVVTFENSEDANSVLKGFTITGGDVGIYCDGASPTISNCVITNNISAGYGGGMYDCYSSPIITNCVFSGNKAGYGGGMYDVNSSPTIINCVFVDNSADANGACIYNYDSSPLLINCTFSGNSAEGDGGGMYSSGSSEPNLINCIFWGNDAGGDGNEIHNDGSADPNFRYCDIAGCGGSSGWDPNIGSDDGNNIDIDPNFIDVGKPAGLDDMFGTFDDGLRLQIVSPCIDAADGDAAPATDICDSGRIDISYINNTGTGDPNYADIGAYESVEVWFVDIDAAGNNDGTSWTDAYTDLKDALSGASSGDEIWVAEGTYKPDDVNDDRSISFELTEGAGVYGGFAGTEVSRQQRNWTVYTTILSGDIGTLNDMNDNSYHVVKGASNAVFDGFWITRGNADGSYPDSLGGGMYNCPASTVKNCIFSDNDAVAGGGIYNDDGASVINCVFSNNFASYYGGGVYNDGQGIEVTNCTFSGNVATIEGGAMGSQYGNPKVTNCIFWGDMSEEIYNYNNASPFFSYCNIQGSGGSSGWDPNFGTDGGGNIDSDPCFIDINNPAGADGAFLTWDDGLRLDTNSLCIDAADGDFAPLQDILRLNRIDVNGVDHNGVGGPDYVDIGAYESYNGLDSDSDGMPDDYEIIHGLDLTDSNDASEDLDNDELSNLLE